MRSCFLTLVLTATSFTSSAWAEPVALRLVRLLDSPGRPHPLADPSGRIPVTVELPPSVSAASLGLLEVAPGIGAIRLAPAEVAPFAARRAGLALSVAPPRHPLLDVSGMWTRAGYFRKETGLDGKGVVVGVVDTGLDILHPDFRDKHGRTRVAWLLTSGPPAGKHAALEEEFGCTNPQQSSCAVYSAEDIDEMLTSGNAAVQDLEGHGTHVTSIAAGNGGPMTGETPKYIGVAPAATLIIGAPGGSGDFYDADILNAARFVVNRAEAMSLPVVVNLSLGGDYGSHDGLSTLEKGLSALVGDDKPGRAIVVAAGNSGQLIDPKDGTGPYGIHTEVHVSPGEEVRVPILADATAKGKGYVWITFRPGDDVDVALEGPDGSRWVDYTGKGSEAGYSDGSGDDATQAGVINNVPSDSSSITPETNSAVLIFAGRWPAGELGVLLRGSGDASLWITADGDARDALYFERALRQGTINVPASAPSLLAVGCTINRVKWTPLGGNPIALAMVGDDPNPVPDGACSFSAHGPTPFGVPKPEISAPGGFIAAAMSDDADPRSASGGLFDLAGCPSGEPSCTVVDNHHAIAAGTSMSSPQVAGAIALLMQLDPSLTQARVTDVLVAGARRPSGHVPDPTQLGPGELDLMGAREALLDPASAPADPDLAKSWYTLSSSYARPDPSWPVWGTVELRKADGTLAGSIDGSKLSLQVEGGVTYQPLTKVARGLWRFAVAGKPEDACSAVAVDVRYAGVSMGPRTLPVGYDVWSAGDPSLTAVGGSCATAQGTPPEKGAWTSLVGLAALVARRLRR